MAYTLKYICSVLMIVIRFLDTHGGNVIRIPPYRDTFAPVTWYAHFNEKCMFDAHLYCTAHYDQGRLLTYETDEAIKQIYNVSLLSGMRIWSGLYVADTTEAEYKWIPEEPADVNVTLGGMVIKDDKRCFEIHLDNKPPHVHEVKCGDDNPFVCAETNISGECGFKHLMTTLSSHTETNTLQECKALCKSTKNCWAFLYTRQMCFLFRNTRADATEKAEMVEKNCFRGVTSTSVSDDDACQHTTLPLQSYSNTVSMTVPGTTPLASSKLCEDTFHTKTLLETVTKENYVTIPSVVHATNYLTTVLTITETKSDSCLETVADQNSATLSDVRCGVSYIITTSTVTETCQDSFVPRTESLCTPVTLVETVQQTIMMPSAVTVSAAHCNTSFIISTATVTDTCPGVDSVSASQAGAPQIHTIERNVDRVTVSIIHTHYMTATQTIAITLSGHVATTPIPCVDDAVKENITTTPVNLNLKIDELKRYLTVTKNSTSRNQNTKISVYEDRPSAMMLGFTSIAIVGILFVLLLYNDVPRVCRDLRYNPECENSKKGSP